MLSVIVTFISILMMIWLVMWIFFKFMYPKPPSHYYPKEGDILTPRQCNYCGHYLEQYRGILEKKQTPDLYKNSYQQDHQDEWFFCNEEHQKDFHAGKSYQQS